MYWEKKGKQNTGQTLDLAVKRAQELGIGYLVVASVEGETAQALLARSGNLKVVVVTHQVGFSKPGEDEMEPKVREELIRAGAAVYTGTHLFAGIDRALRLQSGGLYPGEIVANTLRMFGQGIKVGVEIAVMALDAGLIPSGQEVVAVAGNGKGADSAAVILPAHSQHFFKTQIREIICMPRG